MTAPRDRDRVNFGAPRPGGALGGLQWRQLGLLVGAGAWALVVTDLVPGSAGALVAICGAAVCGVAALTRPGGRLPLDWGVVATGFARRRALRRTRYRRLCEAERCRLPDHLTGVQILEVDTDHGLVGVVRDGRRVVAMVSVDAVPAALAAVDEAAAQRSAWGAVLAGLARPGAGVARLQWVVHARPLGPRTRAAFLPDAPDAVIPAIVADSYRELVAQAGDQLRQHVVTLAVAAELGREPSSATARRVLTAAHELADGIRSAGIGTAGLLEPAEVAARLRGPFEDDLGDRFAAGPGMLLPDPGDVGPMGVDEEWGRVHCDGRWHAVFWISQWPRGEADSDILEPLVLAGPAGRSVAVVMAPRDPVRAVRDAEQARVRDAADDDLRARTGFMGSVRRTRQQAAVAATEHELADGHAAYRFAGFVGVSADSPDELEIACREAVAAATLAHCELRRLWGEQAAGLASVLPICRGLA